MPQIPSVTHLEFLQKSQHYQQWFALFPVIGVTQGFMPIAGYNYGAKKYSRVREIINTSIKYAGILAIIIFAIIMSFPDFFVSIFLSDKGGNPQTIADNAEIFACLLYTSPSPRDQRGSRMPSSA